MTCTMEPLVNMGQVTRALLPKGYALKIQVEMEELTIGGLTCGLGMETNCHKVGLMQECIVSWDVVLADGTLAHVTRDNEYKDLFECLPWSCGTLGFLVAVEVQMQKVKPYVKATYIPCFTQAEHIDKLTDMSIKGEGTYLESTIYSYETAVIQLIDFVDEVEVSKVNPVNYWWKPWYYEWVATAFEKNENVDKDGNKAPGFYEFIPLRHYYHRYTRSIFWELRDLVPVGNTWWYRYFLGWLGAPKISFIKLFMSPKVREEVVYKHVVQDIIVPIKDMKSACDLFHEEFDIYPLLVFPIRIYDNGPGEPQGFLRRPINPDGTDGPGDHRPGKKWEMFFDLGAYGVPEKVRRKEEWDAVSSLLKMEKYTREKAGYQCFYADLFCTRDEYREMFDHSLYDKVREKYGATKAFPEVYTKIVPEVKIQRNDLAKKAA